MMRRAATARAATARHGSTVRVAASAAPATTATPLPFAVKEDAAQLFSPVKLGSLQLAHRVVMAPLTRCRAPDNVPAPVMAEYYGQRATPGGLIISEATAICPEARGYPQVPGIYTQEQVDGWKPVVQAVKDKGGLFLCQLWHVGRASHQDFQPSGGPPVAPSAIAIGSEFEVYTPKGGPFPYPVPRALEAAEIPGIIDAYVAAARNALAAGFDGVEIHGATGYLLDQFWKDSSNTRTDEYGGSDANKARLLLDVTAAVADAVGPERVGLRLAPYNTFCDAFDTVDRAIEKNVWLMKSLDERVPGLAYVHMIEPRVAAGIVEVEGVIEHSLEPFRAATSRPFLAAGGIKRDAAIEMLKAGQADAIVFGRNFISNPDLPQRLALDAPLNRYDRATFYAFGPEGYTDYPFLQSE